MSTLCATGRPSARHNQAAIATATRNDPQAFTRLLSYTIKATAVPKTIPLEYFCTENAKSSSNYD